MTPDQQLDRSDGTCPNCGASVHYRGVGRRPIWCSSRCRNDASLKRLGARRAAVEVRVVEVLRQRHPDDTPHPRPTTQTADQQDATSPTLNKRPPRPTSEQALRIVRNDPESVGKLLSHLERRRADGALSEPKWLPVRNALRLIASGLPVDVERPT
jgi:hypothetical protein